MIRAMIENAMQRMRDIQDFGEQGGVVPVVDVAATSTFLNPADMERTFKGELEGCYLYSRHSNPTVSSFGKKLAAMEGMESALGVASGMAAIASAIEQTFINESRISQKNTMGGHIVSSRVVYGGTYALMEHLFPRRGIETTFVDPRDVSAFEAAIRPGVTKVLYTETMSNPLLAISQLDQLGKLAKKYGLTFIVDNTFTPLIFTPHRYGADIVVYSCTKYISGASDLIAGAIVGTQAFIDSLIDVNHGVVMLTGPVMDSRIAHELYLRLDHLGLRMKAHSKSADFFARKLEAEGIPAIYPGLESHRDHALMRRLMSTQEWGYGGMVTLDCGSVERALKLAKLLQDEIFGLYAVSLGFSRTLLSIPSISTSSEIPEDERSTMGLKPGLLRMSMGYVGDDELMWERFLSAYRLAL